MQIRALAEIDRYLLIHASDTPRFVGRTCILRYDDAILFDPEEIGSMIRNGWSGPRSIVGGCYPGTIEDRVWVWVVTAQLATYGHTWYIDSGPLSPSHEERITIVRAQVAAWYR